MNWSGSLRGLVVGDVSGDGRSDNRRGCGTKVMRFFSAVSKDTVDFATATEGPRYSEAH